MLLRLKLLLLALKLNTAVGSWLLKMLYDKITGLCWQAECSLGFQYLKYLQYITWKLNPIQPIDWLVLTKPTSKIGFLLICSCFMFQAATAITDGVRFQKRKCAHIVFISIEDDRSHKHIRFFWFHYDGASINDGLSTFSSFFIVHDCKPILNI